MNSKGETECGPQDRNSEIGLASGLYKSLNGCAKKFTAVSERVLGGGVYAIPLHALAAVSGILSWDLRVLLRGMEP
jgi:hypothetical protein